MYMRISVITRKNGEIRDFTPINANEFEKAMLKIKDDVKFYDGFDINYDMEDIISTVVWKNHVYIGENCIIENIDHKGYTLLNVCEILGIDIELHDDVNTLVKFVNRLNNRELISVFGEVKEIDVEKEYKKFSNAN